jgi:hypothetical protein
MVKSSTVELEFLPRRKRSMSKNPELSACVGRQQRQHRMDDVKIDADLNAYGEIGLATTVGRLWITASRATLACAACMLCASLL